MRPARSRRRPRRAGRAPRRTRARTRRPPRAGRGSAASRARRRRASTLLRRGRVALERRLGRVPAARLQRRLHGEGAAQAVLERPVGPAQSQLEQAERRVPRPPVSRRSRLAPPPRRARCRDGTPARRRHGRRAAELGLEVARDRGLPGVLGDPQARRCVGARVAPALRPQVHGCARLVHVGEHAARIAPYGLRVDAIEECLGPVDLAGHEQERDRPCDDERRELQVDVVDLVHLQSRDARALSEQRVKRRRFEFVEHAARRRAPRPRAGTGARPRRRPRERPRSPGGSRRAPRAPRRGATTSAPGRARARRRAPRPAQRSITASARSERPARCHARAAATASRERSAPSRDLGRPLVGRRRHRRERRRARDFLQRGCAHGRRGAHRARGERTVTPNDGLRRRLDTELGTRLLILGVQASAAASCPTLRGVKARWPLTLSGVGLAVVWRGLCAGELTGDLTEWGPRSPHTVGAVLLRLVLAVALGALALLPGVARSQEPLLLPRVGPGQRLRDLVHARRRHPGHAARAGRLRIQVTDEGSSHDFRVRGPGVNMGTTYSFLGQTTLTATFTDGYYAFYCAPHRGQMEGVFTVGAPPAPTLRPTTDGESLSLDDGRRAVTPAWTRAATRSRSRTARTRRACAERPGCRRGDQTHTFTGAISTSPLRRGATRCSRRATRRGCGRAWPSARRRLRRGANAHGDHPSRTAMTLLDSDGAPARGSTPATTTSSCAISRPCTTPPRRPRRRPAHEPRARRRGDLARDAAGRPLCLGLRPAPITMRGSVPVGGGSRRPPPPPVRRLALRVSARGAVTASPRHAAAGTTVVTVRDSSARANVHLTGPGVNRRTGVRFRRTATWRLRLRTGRYRVRSDTGRTA